MIYSIVLLISIAIFFWLANFRILNVGRDWPLLLVLLGTILLLKTFRRHRRSKVIDDLAQGRITVEEAERLLKKDRS